MRIKAGILVRSTGPYHNARFNELQKTLDVHVIETRAFYKEYDWDKKELINPLYQSYILSPGNIFARILQIWKILLSIKPNIIFTHGWADFEYIVALFFAKLYGTIIVSGCDSTLTDVPRKPLREKLKRIIVQQFDAFLSAGTRSEKYLHSLGFTKKIFSPYDVVDNEYFNSGTKTLKIEHKQNKYAPALPTPYILNISRLIPKKNHLFLIETYNDLLNSFPDYPFNLVIVGSGELEKAIRNKIDELNLTNKVYLFPFAQYSELPKYYAFAKAFVLPSYTDQWGLVVNEAMASELPVLVSDGCGCADNLVFNGENGYIFKTNDKHQLMEAMKKIALISNEELNQMGTNSYKIILNYSPAQFAKAFCKFIKL